MSLAYASTKELVEELRRREGVDTCVVEPEWQYEVAVMTDRPHPTIAGAREYLSGGMHFGDNKGPAIVLVVID